MILKIGELEYPIETCQIIAGIENNYWDSTKERIVITFVKDMTTNFTEMYNAIVEHFQGEIQIITSDNTYTYTEFKQIGSLTMTIVEDDCTFVLSLIEK